MGHGKPITVSQDAAVSGFAIFRRTVFVERSGRRFQSRDLYIGKDIPHAVDDERAFLEVETTMPRANIYFRKYQFVSFSEPTFSTVHSIKRMHYVLEESVRERTIFREEPSARCRL